MREGCTALSERAFGLDWPVADSSATVYAHCLSSGCPWLHAMRRAHSSGWRSSRHCESTATNTSLVQQLYGCPSPIPGRGSWAIDRPQKAPNPIRKLRLILPPPTSLISIKLQVPEPATRKPTDGEFYTRDATGALKPNPTFLKQHFFREGRLTEDQALSILEDATSLLRKEPNMVQVKSPVTSMSLLLIPSYTSQ